MQRIAPQITHKGFMPLEKDGVCFIKIPKVGSTTANAVLKDANGWCVCSNKAVDENWEFVALIRHPVDRWLSGMAQWGSAACHDRLSLEDSIDKMVFDVHTQPQSWWIKGVAPTLFKLENIQKLWSYLDITTEEHRNTRKPNSFVLEKKHEEKILSYYADDLHLWEVANG